MQGWKLLCCSRHSSEPPTAQGQQVPHTHLLLKQILSQLLPWAVPKETLQPLNCLHTVSLSPRDFLPTARSALKATSPHSQPSQQCRGMLPCSTHHQADRGGRISLKDFLWHSSTPGCASFKVTPRNSELSLFLGRHGSHYNDFAACCNWQILYYDFSVQYLEFNQCAAAPTLQQDELGVRITS